VPAQVGEDIAPINYRPRFKGFAPVPSSPNKSAAFSGRVSGVQADARINSASNGQVSPTFRASKLIGTTITDQTGQVVGRIEDFVADARGNPIYPIVSYTGSPGFSGKLFAVPFGSFRFGVGANQNTTAQFAFDSQLLRNAPNFASSQFPDFSDPSVQNQFTAFYSSALS